MDVILGRGSSDHHVLNEGGKEVKSPSQVATSTSPTNHRVAREKAAQRQVTNLRRLVFALSPKVRLPLGKLRWPCCVRARVMEACQCFGRQISGRPGLPPLRGCGYIGWRTKPFGKYNYAPAGTVVAAVRSISSLGKHT
uniref:BHLH domain-containing protein n=1 Tax=Trichuris muris TaxID=70415 RepID=A0A5S6QWQ0_TRIMR